MFAVEPQDLLRFSFLLASVEPKKLLCFLLINLESIPEKSDWWTARQCLIRWFWSFEL